MGFGIGFVTVFMRNIQHIEYSALIVKKTQQKISRVWKAKHLETELEPLTKKEKDPGYFQKNRPEDIINTENMSAIFC